MVTYILMSLILLFLFGLLAVGASFQSNSNHFFDKSNSNSMRGFWSLIVILVHVPLAYQNKVQDMIGSFAYIGVTFFFMTSAYGLMFYTNGNRTILKNFWKRRLTKILIPCFLSNIVSVIVSLIIGNEFTLISLVQINKWVIWILICYIFFWGVNLFLNNVEERKNVAICIEVIVFSLIIYICKDISIIGGWYTEIYGFVWGIIMFEMKDRFKTEMCKNWLIKCFILCFISCVFGVGYLKFKSIVFWGDYLLKIVLGLLITLFVLALNTKIEIGNGVSRLLGNISYEIYLLHGTAFSLIKFLKPDVNSGIFIALSIILTVGISSVVNILGGKIIKILYITKVDKY